MSGLGVDVPGRVLERLCGYIFLAAQETLKWLALKLLESCIKSYLIRVLSLTVSLSPWSEEGEMRVAQVMQGLRQRR